MSALDHLTEAPAQSSVEDSPGAARSLAEADRAAHARLMRFIVLSIVAMGALHFLGRLGLHLGLYGMAVSDVFTLFGFLVLGGSAFHALRHVYNIPRIARTLFLGTVLVALAQGMRVAESAELLTGLTAFESSVYQIVKEGGFVLGIGMLVAGFYLCLFEADLAKRGLMRDRGELLREIQERERAQRALKDSEEHLRQAYAEVERRVEERTAKLAEANRNLQTEAAERARAEVALRESERRYRTLAETAQDVIFIVDRKDRVEYVNSFAAQQLGIRVEDIIGKQRSALFPPEIAEGQRSRLETVFATGRAVRVENRARFQDRVGWQDTHLVPLKDNASEIVAVLGVSRDITERKRAEQTLRDSEERYRGLIEGLQEAVYRIALPEGRYEYVGPAAKLVFGYEAEQILKEPMFLKQRIHPDFTPYLEKAWNDLLEGTIPPAYEYKIVDPDGHERWILQSNTLVRDASGKPVSVEGICRNITEEKRALQVLEEHRSRLMESSKWSVLGEMAANMAHEINNPLAVIAGSAEQLKRALDEGRDAPALRIRLMDTIARNASRIQQIVKGLRGFSREGSQDPFEIVSLRAIFEDTAVVCRESFRAQHVAFTVDDLPEGLAVECHPTQLMEVLVNLLNNAQHAVETLSEKWVSLSATDQGDFVEITVTDSGAGIAPGITSTLFDPFVTTKAAGKGTGLGLSISKRILQGHHGTIAVDPSSENTRFVIRLPKCQPTEA